MSEDIIITFPAKEVERILSGPETNPYHLTRAIWNEIAKANDDCTVLDENDQTFLETDVV